MQTLRQKYAKIHKNLEDRIDEAAAEWLTTEDPKLLWKYKALAYEMTEIKEVIISSEKETS